MATSADIQALRDEIARLKLENSKLQEKSIPPLKMEITDRQQVAIVFGKYNCRLYKSQWLRILENQEQLKSFIKENDEQLA